MKVEVDVRELIVEGLPEVDRTAFARRLGEELAARFEADAPGLAGRQVENVSVAAERPLGGTADAAVEVARAVQREVSK